MEKMPLGKFPRFSGLELEAANSLAYNKLLRPSSEAVTTSSSSSSASYFPKFSKEQKSSFCIESLLRTEDKVDRYGGRSPKRLFESLLSQESLEKLTRSTHLNKFTE
jgi:hypothetical protein